MSTVFYCIFIKITIRKISVIRCLDSLADICAYYFRTLPSCTTVNRLIDRVCFLVLFLSYNCVD